MRTQDAVRNFLFDNVLTDYYAATIAREDMPPFTNLDAKILIVRQSGSPSDDDVLRHNCEVYLFSEANAEPRVESELAAEAQAAHEYILNNFKFEDASGLRVFGMYSVEPPGATFFTGQDRYYIKFTIRTHTTT